MRLKSESNINKTNGIPCRKGNKFGQKNIL